ARQSAEEATVAANQTATAVRDATQRAVIEARRAAQMVRAETAALTDAADATLQRLAEAAKSARAASEESQAAAERHVASIERRLTALAATAQVKKPEPVIERAAERIVERPVARVANEAFADKALYVAAVEAPVRVNERRPAPVASGFTNFKGVSEWTNFTPDADIVAANADVSMDGFDFSEFGTVEIDPDQLLKQNAIDLIAAAGVELSAALDTAALDGIAQRSRLGATSRRRAVAEAAPVAVSRIARYTKRNADALDIAAEFRKRPDLAKTESRGSEIVRAFLLIDAAMA
ncbi:MAG: hypothetical protein ABW199_06910, partial [Caulobacterales bacterium]